MAKGKVPRTRVKETGNNDLGSGVSGKRSQCDVGGEGRVQSDAAASSEEEKDSREGKAIFQAT